MIRLLPLYALLGTAVGAPTAPPPPSKVPAPSLPQDSAGSFAITDSTFAPSATALHILDRGRLVRRDPETFSDKAWTRGTDLSGPIVPAGPQVYALSQTGYVLAFESQHLQRRWTATRASTPQRLLPDGAVVLAVRLRGHHPHRWDYSCPRSGWVRVRVEGGGVPVRVGSTLFVPAQGDLVAFRMP